MFNQIHMNKFRERPEGLKDGWAKSIWLKKHDYKTHYWSQWLTLYEMRDIGRTMYYPDTEEVANWMIKHRTVRVTERSICFNIRAFCWASGKRLFLKPVIVVHTQITGPGEPVDEKFYFEPKQYTVWLLKN